MDAVVDKSRGPVGVPGEGADVGREAGGPPAVPQEQPFWNPYLGGIVLGLVLLSCYVVMGFGLGASGALGRIGIGAAHVVAPKAVESVPYYAKFVGPGKSVLDDWLVFEVLGVFLGGVVGAYTAGRLRRGVQVGQPGKSVPARLALALVGGIIMGIGARYGHGCTSGQALTGGALLSVGSWAFMIMVFAGGYLFAPFLRRQWL